MTTTSTKTNIFRRATFILLALIMTCTTVWAKNNSSNFTDNVTVPELTVGEVTDTTANVSWTACDGVTEYTLQLASDDQFTTGSSGETLTETFANATFSTTSSSYTNQTISGGDLGTWTATSCRGDQGSPIIRYAGTLTSPTITGGVAAVEFDYSWPYSESGTCNIELYVGDTLMGTASVTGGTAGTATYTLDSPVTGSTSIKLINKATSSKRMCVTEVRITTPGSGSNSLILETTVADTEYTFTDLTPYTVYYARVKGNDDWSNVEEFLTEETVILDSAPVWSPNFPATATVEVGQFYTLDDVSSYVSGTPAPIITMSAPAGLQAEFENDTFVFGAESAGDFTFTFTAVNGVSPDATATLVVTAVGQAPELNASLGTSLSSTVGEDVSFTVTATGTPAPTINATCTEGAFFLFENGEFHFYSDAVGTYHFIFTAENSEGTDTMTVTIEVSAAPVAIPDLLVSDITDTEALATWTACDGVTEYTLQLASDDQFTTGGSSETLTETFTNVTFTTTGSSYTDQTISGGDLGTWTATSCRGDKDYPIIRYAGTLTSPTIAGGVAAVEFDYSWPFSESGSCDIELYVGGELMGTASVTGGTAGTATYTLESPVTGPTSIKLLNKASSNKRMCVTEVRITVPSSGSGSGSLIAEYSVSDTEYTFTGLTPYTVYYARVKGNDDWSNVEEFLTEEATVTSMITREITGYGENNNKWAFIASPVSGSIAPDAVGNIFDATEYDLYRFNQSAAPQKEWENYKATTSTNHADFTSLVNGHGYLYATKETQTLVFTGEFNTDASKTLDLDYTEGQDLAGWNLVGNPFAADAYVNRPFYQMNEAGTGIEPVANYDNYTAVTIPPCTGIMVQAQGENETVTFSTTEPSKTASNNGYLEITLAEQVTTRGGTSSSTIDKAIVSFNEGEELGKFYFGTQNANIYIPQGNEEYAIAYSDAHGEMPLNFKAQKDGEYTLTVSSPLNSQLSILNLIDNLTGANIDLLQTPSYTFEGRTTDYASRFKLVFATDNANLGDEGNDHFAFIDSNGNLIVNGDGLLQVLDILGHQLFVKQLSTLNSQLSIPTSPGVYVLRLVNGDNVRTQKIFVK